MSRWRQGFNQLRRYPSAVAGLAIIALLVGVSIYTLIALPYRTAVEMWRGGEMWAMTPVNASPLWVDWFTRDALPRTIAVGSYDMPIERDPFEGGQRVTIPMTFDYQYDGFPSEINVFFGVMFREREPFVRMTWIAPDGREIPLGGRRLPRDQRVSISQDWNLERRLGAPPHVGLLAHEIDEAEPPRVLKGEHTLRIDAILFEENAELFATLGVYGRVHGWAGTDHQRRDILLALMWGTPVALAFGLLAAVGTTVTTLVIAAIGVWFGGLVDAAIQRLTEVNMILPLLPILVMIGTLYSQSIWLMLGVVVALGVFSAQIKVYRAMLLPIRESPYIEAARAYGAGHARVIGRYMIPRILPVLIPTFVNLIPMFVFLEASLAVLGLGDPVLPTWGKVLSDAMEQGALYAGYYYLVLEPAALLMLTGLGFAMLGFALDRIFNPRLRTL